MNSEDNEIEYQGPHLQWVPPLADSQNAAPQNAPITARDTYADEDLLRRLLDALEKETNAAILEMEKDLSFYAVPVSNNQPDDKLAAANRQEHPAELGDPPDYISYYYYKGLESKNSSAATYIRDKYASAMRDVHGTSSFDFIGVVRDIQTEGLRIGGFLDNYVGSVVDESEHRILELFQDWAREAIDVTGSLRRLARSGAEEYKLSDEDVKNTSPDEAVNAQAIFKTKLNFLNQQIVGDTDNLHKTFFDYSDAFYDQFLGPSLNFRINVSSQLDPLKKPSAIQTELRSASNTLDANLQTLIADQLRRNQIFHNGFDSLQTNVILRDTYKTYIYQLEAKRPKPSLANPGNPGYPISDYSASEDEINYFTDMALTQSVSQATPDFSSQHNWLDGRDHPDAHPHLLNKYGDTIIGEIFMAEGAMLDGMRPGGASGHRHMGLDVDGTRKIRGEDIEDLVTGPILREYVCPPVQLRLLEQTPRVIPPGGASVNATIAWDTCNPNFLYEIELSLITVEEVALSGYCATTLFNLEERY